MFLYISLCVTPHRAKIIATFKHSFPLPTFYQEQLQQQHQQKQQAGE